MYLWNTIVLEKQSKIWIKKGKKIEIREWTKTNKLEKTGTVLQTTQTPDKIWNKKNKPAYQNMMENQLERALVVSVGDHLQGIVDKVT